MTAQTTYPSYAAARAANPVAPLLRQTHSGWIAFATVQDAQRDLAARGREARLYEDAGVRARVR